ncbi:MAG: response regulator [Chloroflexota bacterium]|nr:response regulator [Chloroflexota bacterium]
MTKKTSVLVIEDDQDIREIIEMILVDEGYRVATAVDGAAGVAEAATFDPDIIVLDLQMPRLDGGDVIRAYRGRADARAKIVVVSAAAKNDPIIGQLRVDDFITKPFDMTDLLRRVQELAPLIAA